MGLFSNPDHEVPLLPIDLQRLGRVGAALRNWTSNRIWPLVGVASHTQRSYLTLLALSEMVKITETRRDVRLTNIRHPDWDGRRQADLSGSALYRQWHTIPSTVHFRGGESLADVAARVDDVLGAFPPQCDRLIVSHSTPLQVMLCRLLHLSLDSVWAFYFEPYAVTAVYSGALVKFNASEPSPWKLEAVYE